MIKLVDNNRTLRFNLVYLKIQGVFMANNFSRYGFLFAICAYSFFLFNSSTMEGEEKSTQEEEIDISKVSEAFGHLIGKNIDTLGIKFDLTSVIKGLKDSADGKTSPMSEVECVQAISAAQEVSFKKQAQENLQKAELFLEKNANDKDIVTLEQGKLQYKITKSGSGTEVQAHNTPLIRYVGKYLDGTIFGSSKEDEMISLDETIPGFNKGLIGMKEGEKRTLFIHPEYGYGTSGYLPPNSLLTFEVELVKANSPKTVDADSLTTSPTKDKSSTQEIATPEFEHEALR